MQAMELQLSMLPCVAHCCLLGCLRWFSRASAGIPPYFSFLMKVKGRFEPICAYSKCSDVPEP